MSQYQQVAMACQGGGSLGAYHIGAYKAIEEAGFVPNTFSGISIGAFTAAILAGNRHEERQDQLINFWKLISRPDYIDVLKNNAFLNSWYNNLNAIPISLFGADTFKQLLNKMSSVQGFTLGQPNFFGPYSGWDAIPLKGNPAATSHYTTAPLKETLNKLVDFDYINSGASRLILGATEVATGKLVFFDSTKTKLNADHIIASGAMPSGFPGIKIDGKLYWDGGIASNTPIEGIYDDAHDTDTLVFMVDLYNPVGKEPETMDELSIRQQEITYASRTVKQIEQLQHRHNLSVALGQTLSNTKMEEIFGASSAMINEMHRTHKFDIVHILYDLDPQEVPSMSCEFSRSSILMRADHGYQDMKEAITNASW
ncbi:MAG: patatin-like phospholipase family protein, partial [Bacteroidota bacterium]